VVLFGTGSHRRLLILSQLFSMSLTFCLLISSKVLPDAVFHSIHPLADRPMTAIAAVLGLENK
jgi:hypothetical protein